MLSIDGDYMFYTYFLLFIIYSIIGWLLEIVFSYFELKKIVNRGFLIGPYCPIYGVGCLLLILLLSDYADNILVLFGLSIIVCSILEYFTSWIMEKIFKLRWWDYTNMKYNINGRICLETMIPFGIIGVIVVKYVNPWLIDLISLINPHTLTIIVIILMSLFIIDILISSNVVFNLKTVTRNVTKDSTEEIKKAIHKFIHNNLFMYDRIVKAFPNMSKIIKEQQEKAKKAIEEINTKAKKEKVKKTIEKQKKKGKSKK